MNGKQSKTLRRVAVQLSDYRQPIKQYEYKGHERTIMVPIINEQGQITGEEGSVITKWQVRLTKDCQRRFYHLLKKLYKARRSGKRYA